MATRLTPAAFSVDGGGLAVIAAELRRALPPTPFGVNVLKNDRARPSHSRAVGATFIPVNVIAGTWWRSGSSSRTFACSGDRRLLAVNDRDLADAGGQA